MECLSKKEQYQKLVEDVRNSYLLSAEDLKWCEDCEEINLWTYWQGRKHFDAPIMLVGQDWGCPWDQNSKEFMDRVRQINRGFGERYIEKDSSHNTDQNLIRLFDSIGFDICEDDPRLFFTNFVLGYREKGCSGGFQKRWARRDAEYFSRLVKIIQPQIILCLGKDTFESVLSSFSYKLPRKIRGYNRFVEGEENPVEVHYGTNQVAYVFALAHCGVMGTLNRNRGTQDRRSLDQQRRDWERIRPYLDGIEN